MSIRTKIQINMALFVMLASFMLANEYGDAIVESLFALLPVVTVP